MFKKKDNWKITHTRVENIPQQCKQKSLSQKDFKKCLKCKKKKKHNNFLESNNNNNNKKNNNNTNTNNNKNIMMKVNVIQVFEEKNARGM